MRVTKEILLNIAETTVQERADNIYDLVAAYLTGSLIGEKPILGDTADIDLVFIHDEMPEEREILRLTEDIHLDIQHYPRSKFDTARDLRSDAWLGTSLFNAKPLYDPHHVIDFIQASVRGMFHQPEYTLARAEPFLLAARQTWMAYHNSSKEVGLDETSAFLDAIENTANAISTLVDRPLSKRRFLQEFDERCNTLSKPGLYLGFLGLLGVNNLAQEDLQNWLLSWEKAYGKTLDLQPGPEDIHPDRKNYYLKAIKYFLGQDNFQFAAWPLLNTWAKLVGELHAGAPLKAEWEDVMQNINLSGEGFASKLEGLDAYLDMVEEFFEQWKKGQGLE